MINVAQRRRNAATAVGASGDQQLGGGSGFGGEQSLRATEVDDDTVGVNDGSTYPPSDRGP